MKALGMYIGPWVLSEDI